MSGIPWRLKDDRGAAAVEFALILPLLILILGGIVDFGFALNAQISLTHAAREGVRVEALEIAGATGKDVAEANYTAPGTDEVLGEVTQSCAGGGPNAVVQITANYDPFLLFFLEEAFDMLSGEATMRCGG